MEKLPLKPPREPRMPRVRTAPGQPWWLIPMAILCLLTLGGSQYLIAWIHSFAFRRRMANAGRRLAIEEAAARCAQGHGFLIQETMGGWPVCRLWWADDDRFIEPTSPAPRTPNLKAHRANHDRYLDPDKGTALLVSPFHFFRGARRTLQTHFPTTTSKWIDNLLASPDEDPGLNANPTTPPK